MRRLLVLVLLVPLLAGTATAADDDGDGIDDVDENTLLSRFAPVLHFHPEEKFFPTAVSYVFANSQLERIDDPNASYTVVDPTPTPTSVSLITVPDGGCEDPTSGGPVYFLNNTKGDAYVYDGIFTSYQSVASTKVVYGHVVDSGGQRFLQYWFYYAFNPGTWNNHEGDWEMVQVVLSGGNPVSVTYSQHHSGTRADWARVLKEGEHPRVYVAKGAHASYMFPYEGRAGNIEADQVADGGTTWRPGEYTVVNLGEKSAPTTGNEWLRYAGRWGEWGTIESDCLGFAGPPGPGFREDGHMWDTPGTWASEVRELNENQLLASWFITNLILFFLLFLGIGALIRVLLLWRAQRKTKVGRRLYPYVHIRPFDRKSAGMVLAIVGMAVGIIGLLLPWYVVTANISAGGFTTGGTVDLIRVDGVEGLSVNNLRKDGRVGHASIMPLPLGVILVITTAYFFLKIAGTKTSRRLGLRFLFKGLATLVPFFLVLFIAFLLGNLGQSLPGEGDGGGSGGGGSDPFREIFTQIKANPFGGRYSFTGGDGSSATLTWGLGPGAWVLLASAVILFVAAGLCFSKKYYFLPPWYVEKYPSPEAYAAATGQAVPMAAQPTAAPAGAPGASTAAAEQPAAAVPPVDPTAERLAKLEKLKAAGLIDEESYQKKLAQIQAEKPQPATPAAAPAEDLETRVKKLRELKDKGLIDQETFLKKMDDILEEKPAAAGAAAAEAKPSEATPAAQPAEKPTPKFCERCGGPLVPGVRFCAKCGAAVVAK